MVACGFSRLTRIAGRVAVLPAIGKPYVRSEFAAELVAQTHTGIQVRAARSAVGRRARKTNGSAPAETNGTHSTRAACAPPTSISGLKPSALSVAAGRRIHFGMPSQAKRGEWSTVWLSEARASRQDNRYCPVSRSSGIQIPCCTFPPHVTDFCRS
jgi:hypothetical protein